MGSCNTEKSKKIQTSDIMKYTEQLLELYRHAPGTLGQVRREDRRLAAQLHDRGVPLRTVKEAFLLATARRCFRPPEAAPLSTIRSLHYFLPVIEEVLARPLHDGYADYLQRKLTTIQAAHEEMLIDAANRSSK